MVAWYTSCLKCYCRYATDDVDSVNLFYTMADLSVEEILDHHIQTPVDIEKVENNFYCFELYCNKGLNSKNENKKKHPDFRA